MIEIFIGVAAAEKRAALGIFMRDTVAQQSVCHYDFLENCTENRAQVFAVQISMTHVPDGSAVRLVTGSRYVHECLPRLTRWESEGRLKDQGVANADLWTLVKYHRDRLNLHLVFAEPSIIPDLDSEYVDLLTRQSRERLGLLA